MSDGRIPVLVPPEAACLAPRPGAGVIPCDINAAPA